MAKFLLATLLLSSVFVAIHCECCGRTNFKYQSKYNDCFDIPGGNVKYTSYYRDPLAAQLKAILSNVCEINICGDGSSHKGFYCGKGSCNAFGCNCDGGCIPGNAKKEFKARYGDRVIDV